MRTSHTPASFLFLSLLVACAASSPEPAPTPSAANAPQVETAAPAPSSDAPAAPEGAAPPDTSGQAKGPLGGPTEEKLRATKSLDDPFPKIAEVTKENGAPFATGKATRRSWRFEKKPLGKTFSCGTIDVIRGPKGRAVFDVSALTSDECKQVGSTKAQLQGALATLSGTEPAEISFMVADVKKSFDEAATALEKALGKPAEMGEVEYGAWRYTDGSGECRVVLVTSRLASKAGQAIWELPCE